jgi:hypothetical protein
LTKRNPHLKPLGICEVGVDIRQRHHKITGPIARYMMMNLFARAGLELANRRSIAKSRLLMQSSGIV